MKPLKNFFLLFLFCLILFAVGAFVGVKLQPEQEVLPERDSVLLRIDTLNHYETIVKEKIKTIRETDTVIYNGTDTACLEIIERKNRLIAGQDTLIELLDLECREYSDLVLIEQSRFKQLSLKIDSTIVLYEHSLKFERKTIKKERSKTFFYKKTTTVAAALGIYGLIK